MPRIPGDPVRQEETAPQNDDFRCRPDDPRPRIRRGHTLYCPQMHSGGGGQRVLPEGHLQGVRSEVESREALPELREWGGACGFGRGASECGVQCPQALFETGKCEVCFYVTCV